MMNTPAIVFSNGDHGYAVDLLVKFFSFDEKDAIEYLHENFEITEFKPIKLYIPKKNINNKVITYLTMDRFIKKSVVDEFINKQLLFEDFKYNNCNFVGYDNHEIKHIHVRSTDDLFNVFKMNRYGSDGDYSFRYIGTSNKLFVFEAPIDCYLI